MGFMKHRLVREIFGVILFAFAVFVFLSLVSYKPKDPSFNHIRPSGVTQARNLTGRFGANVAELALIYGGGIAFLLPLMIVLMAWGQFKLESWKQSVAQLAGIFLFVFSTCGMLSLITFDTELRIFKNFTYGGAIGELAIRPFLITYFNFHGTCIMLCTLLVISILILTNLSLYDLIFSMKDMAVQSIVSIRKWRADRRKDSKPWRKNRAEKSRRANSKLSGEGKAEGERKPPRDKDRKLKQALAAYKGPLPPLTLLDQPEKLNISESKQSIQESSKKLEVKLLDFGVQGKVIQVYPGPVVTRYEFEPAPGIKISKISNLSDDLALAMKAVSVRIVAPVPGKSVVGLEIPNQHREKVYLREILESESFKTARSRLALALGKDIAGLPYVTDLARMPHLLVAGATGSGKSVSVNTIICSILFNATAEEVKFIMIDPKMLELGVYNDIPHLMAPVVVDPKEAANALRWATREMENRYRILAERGVRNIDQFNQLVQLEGKREESEPPSGEESEPPSSEERIDGPLPYIVIVIDEFADLMIMAAREVETLLIRLAQMARAVGIHLILATQRPSVDVVTGLIKANFPCRISFRVSSKTDSRTILDANGAERLLGHGDMLFLPPNSSEIIRLHGSFITEGEIKRMVKYLCHQGSPEYDDTILAFSAEEAKSENSPEDKEYDDLYDKAVDLVLKTRQASISMIQRRLRIGYNRAARMIEIMEKEGVVSKPQGSKPREVLIDTDYER